MVSRYLCQKKIHVYNAQHQNFCLQELRTKDMKTGDFENITKQFLDYRIYTVIRE